MSGLQELMCRLYLGSIKQQDMDLGVESGLQFEKC